MRLFVCEEDNKKNLMTFTGKNFHRLRRVLRKKVGDKLSLSFKDGSLSMGEIIFMDDKNSSLQIKLLQNIDGGQEENAKTHSVTASEVQRQEGKREWNLFQFITKAKTMEKIVRQASECGVKNIIPVMGEYTQTPYVKSLESKMTRMQTIINEARVQSASPVQTKFYEPMKIGDALNFWGKEKNERSSFACFMWEKDGGEAIFKADGKAECVALAVGSEGGISEKEAQTLKGAGFLPLHIRGNILKSDTAVVYSLAYVRAILER